MISAPVAVTLAAAVQSAFGMHMVLHQPTISFPNGYDTNRANQVESVLGSSRFKFLAGDAWDNDFGQSPGAILVYDGDAQSLTAFLAALNEVEGIRVRLTFSHDLSKETGSALPAGSWWVEYSQAKPDTVTVRVNLAAESLGRDKFELILPKYAQREMPSTKINQDYTLWVENCLKDFETIKAGMTRNGIENRFPMDGGLQSVSPVRIVHPTCPFFKIDVEFDLKRDAADQNRAIRGGDDKVTKVSKPYIERPFFD